MSNVSLVDGHIDEPKMTDEEIKKALEGLSSGCFDCRNGCACSDTSLYCPVNVIKYALDLINRKDAEIERLKDELAQTEDAFNKIYEINGAYERKIDTIKSKAIKEFAFDLTEEVKEINTSNRSEDKDDIIIHVLDIIDNLKKCPKFRPDER